MHALVHGRVQGVNFRRFVERHADALGLTGYVRNLASGRQVEVYAEGSKSDLDILIEHLYIGPPRAIVEKVDITWSEAKGGYTRFGVKY